MRRALAHLSIALALIAAPAMAAEEPADPFERAISLHRTSAMISQVDDLSITLAKDYTLDPTESPEDFYAILFDQALKLELARSQACLGKVIQGALCTERFAAGWLRPPGTFKPSFAELYVWSDELQASAMTLWSAVCDKAPRPKDDELGPCPME